MTELTIEFDDGTVVSAELTEGQADEIEDWLFRENIKTNIKC